MSRPKGLKHTEETKRKISKMATGRKRKPFSKEWRNKMSEAHKGKRRKPFTNDWKKRISDANVGNKHPNWQGGITPMNAKIRNSIESRLWREAVLARDNWTCQRTGDRGGILNAHHIQDFSTYPELRFAIDNGITLSKKAHIEFHKIYGKDNNNKEQMEEFLREK